MNLRAKRILLGVTGGIAAYKSAELLRQLQRAGAQVRVAMTESATTFVTPLTFQALSGNPVAIEDNGQFDQAGMDHIALARWADILLIAPCTANFTAKLAQGIADDLLSSTCLAFENTLAIAPAMNQAMWANKATQNNIEQLKSRGVHIFGPANGEQACGEVGEGRMLEPLNIVTSCDRLFQHDSLHGKQVLLTAGPTQEAIDPVRYITNRSSGKMGYALANAALAAGAEVTVVCGPNHCEENERVRYIPIETAAQMHTQVMQHMKTADIFIAAAAVADYRPVTQSDNKLKKNNSTLRLELTRNPDILQDVKQARPELFCVGFAAETNNVVEYARGKLEKKSLDMIVANQVGVKHQGFDSDYNAVEVLTTKEHRSIAHMRKDLLADKLVSIISEHYFQRNPKSNVSYFHTKKN